ncbi:tripartite-type tricarboxylate transporter receptor subunit TctC [Humitalea rosea]|uniref:Tripartite-type tricarboxylate transporter receptor subunit TctC n=1 Tax=Humitalea rosea TaxID=990373 RepID=A0A2W7IJ34_9PROT|nr:tripartite tricarboxylate transporter substrate binding protein [Humitalea rosea]PZW46658.1 tripartite-type tricarboxylate transporter receptor subunit TctC [Humitalea rosea]
MAALPATARAQTTAQATAWPTRPVTLVVPWAAGGGTDTVARIFAQGLEQTLGQPINVVNRTGGNGVVGHAAIANATPDGYTIGAGTSEFVNFKALGQSDIGPGSFDLISHIASIPAGVTVKADAPWADIKAFVAALREGRKGQFTGSGVSTGGSWHLAAAGMTKSLGMEADRIRWIPSQGGAPALQDLVASGITVFTGSPIEAKALVEAGQVRVLAVMANERMSAFPNVPTLKDSGIDWVYENWFSLVAPRGLPKPIHDKLVELGARAHALPEVRSQMVARSIVPVWDGPEAFGTYATQAAVRSGELLRDLGLARG